MTQLTITRHDDPPDTMTIHFDPPVPFKGGQITEIALKEPTARQVRDAEREYTVETPWAGQTAYEQKMIGLVAKLTQQQVDVLPIGATNYAAAFLQEFLEAGVATGDEDDSEEPDTSGPIELAIDPPLNWNGTKYEMLELREPMASEIRNARKLMRQGGSLFESRRCQMALVTAVSGLPAPVIEGLRISTLNEASRILGRFTMAGRPTGKR